MQYRPSKHSVALPAGAGTKRLDTTQVGRVGILALVLVAGLAILISVFTTLQLARPLPPLTVKLAVGSSIRIAGQPPILPWPDQGEALLDLEGVGSLGSAGGNGPLPLASVTKVMTALIVLDDHPIPPGAQGPELTVTPEDVTTYQSDLSSDESAVQVVAGEQLTEFQALEGLLLPSANNFADMLAVWDAGSVGAFVAKMNDEAAVLGLTGTHYVDPSGFDPGNVGTPSDQVRLAEAALDNPTLAAIVAEPQATVPVAGIVQNVDDDLGQNGIIGVKTGSDSAAGGCFVFAARQDIGGLQTTLVGSVLGQQGLTPLTAALESAEDLVASAFSSLRVVHLFGRTQAVAYVTVPWSRSVSIVTAIPATMIGSPGMVIDIQTRLRRPRVGLPSGTRFGDLALSLGEEHLDLRLITSHRVPTASLLWRLLDNG